MYQQILVAVISFVTIGSVYAATPAVTPSPSSNIENLKERLATKVAELRQVQKKAIDGTVKATSVSTITVETKTSDVKIELTDEINVFQTINGKRTTLTTDNIEKGDYVVVFGDYDATLDLLKAKVIVIEEPLPPRFSGVISDIDKKNFTVTFTATGGQSYLVDIEKNTEMLARDAEKGIVKGGFSKLEIGNIIHVTGVLEAKKENQISATRLIDIGAITGTTPTPTVSATPTASPSATAKATPKATPTP
jgi:intein/homing endonuclease